MLRRLEVGVRPGLTDAVGRRMLEKIRQAFDLDVSEVSVVKVYTLEGLSPDDAEDIMEEAGLHDPVLHVASFDPLPGCFDWAVEVSFRPGVTDNEGRTARETVALILGPEHDAVNVYTSTQFRFQASLQEDEVRDLARNLLANELIQRFSYLSGQDFAQGRYFEPRPSKVRGQSSDQVDEVCLNGLSDEELVALSAEHVWALSLKEMRFIRDHFASEEVRVGRRAVGLPVNPTDAEMEVLAQTWSEHCKHKIFNARINYKNEEAGRTVVIDRLFANFIQKPTEILRKRRGQDDFCLSVFKDNAGVIRFTDSHNICIKVETHNSPSALDPYGGALTGIVGVNRDPMGTGLGANLLCNMDVFCFASPFWDQPLPPRLMHPSRIMEGVREGVEHGGNKSGIPTVNGSFVFDERYLGKPLVYCGTVGLMPALVDGRLSHEKQALPGDFAVMVGGRIGKDGIHGATFSSEELSEASPATAVQIGDPITQRKMYDFIMRVRDMGLYRAITDNGAGGLSSSMGEMACDSGGCQLDLADAPLKYDGLRPWEILLSEAQERMTLAVPPEHLEEFLALAMEMEVEATSLGCFTDSGLFQVSYAGKPVACLDMDFMHDAVPQLELEAVWRKPVLPRSDFPEPDHGSLLKTMLGRLNICSKEYAIRQYDHEVKGASVIKPLVGPLCDGPADAAVLRPLLDREEGLVLAHGIAPRYSDLDAYWMMAWSVDEAVRNAVAVGADPDFLAGVDNFCWCDPVASDKTPDGAYKLAQLVRANQALAHYCLAFGVPCVSGKDSMKNDYVGGGVKISIPPTVLFTVMGVIPDVNKTVTSDLKEPGNHIYILGRTGPELGGSELASQLGLSDPRAPQVEAVPARTRYRTLYQAIRSGLVRSCHDLSEGGLAVAMAEMCLAGRLGAVIDLDKLPVFETPSVLERLYAESASRLLVEVAPERAAEFEALFQGQAVACIGRVEAEPVLRINAGGRELVRENAQDLAVAWQATLRKH